MVGVPVVDARLGRALRGGVGGATRVDEGAAPVGVDADEGGVDVRDLGPGQRGGRLREAGHQVVTAGRPERVVSDLLGARDQRLLGLVDGVVVGGDRADAGGEQGAGRDGGQSCLHERQTSRVMLVRVPRSWPAARSHIVRLDSPEATQRSCYADPRGHSRAPKGRPRYRKASVGSTSKLDVG